MAAMAMALPLSQPPPHSCSSNATATATATATGAGGSRSCTLVASSSIVRIIGKPKMTRNDEHVRYGAAMHRNGTIMCARTASATNEARFAQKTKELEHVSRVRKSSLNLINADSSEDNGELDAPIKDTDDWFKQKPSGFGNGKTYDISLEEKLAQQMELDAKAQVASKQNFKEKGRVCVKEKKTAPTPQGTKVWVGKLPKKKNVEIDLRKNFKNAQGLLHIEPIEAGDEKTRHPLCKGFAFLTFANKDDASSFMAKWEGEKCMFGKVEKKLTFQFAEEENTGESRPATKGNAAFLSKESHLSITENRTPVSLCQAIEAAFLSKRQSELQEPQSVSGAMRVTGALSPSSHYGLQMELLADKESTTDRPGCILATNETGRAASQLPKKSISTRNFKDLGVRGSIKRETEALNSNIQTIRDTQEDTGSGSLNSGPEKNPLKQIVANTDIAIRGYENIDACPQSTLAAEVHTSVETAVIFDDHDLEKVIIEQNNDVPEVSPQFEVLSFSLNSSLSLESASDAVHYDQTSKIHSLEAVNSVDGKDKRIHELELKVRDLECQLQKQVLSTKAALEERTELLEKFTLQKLKSEATKSSTLKTSQKPSVLSDTKSSNTKNWLPRSAKRLKKEKQVLANVVAKYVAIS